MVKSIENNTYQYRPNKLIGLGPQVTIHSKYVAYPPLKAPRRRVRVAHPHDPPSHARTALPPPPAPTCGTPAIRRWRRAPARTQQLPPPNCPDPRMATSGLAPAVSARQGRDPPALLTRLQLDCTSSCDSTATRVDSTSTRRGVAVSLLPRWAKGGREEGESRDAARPATDWRRLKASLRC